MVDATKQWAVVGETSPRHRLWNNLPGTPAFCPLVFRTESLDRFVEMDNVSARDDTGDFYRFFDATPHAEFLYECVCKTIAEDLPREADFLGRYDRFPTAVETIAFMPERTIDQLFRFLHQNRGSLSKRDREREFSKLTGAEVTALEKAYAQIFQ